MSICDLSVFNMKPKADERFVVKGDNYRFTVLTEKILRLEYSPDGMFEDRATRIAFNRAFAEPEYESYFEDGLLHVVTKYLHLTYDEKPFSSTGLQISVKATERYQAQYWFYGRELPHNYGGTVRTLDGVNGSIPLPDGLIGRARAFSLLDDSNTIAIGEDGWPVPVGRNGRIDIYFFGNAQFPEECIKDFYKLSAPVPLLPRFALGNWWSRYYKYTADEYLELMDKFKEENIPLAVGIVDMDWHITKAADGARKWTGFTWNEELFPNYKQFISDLHGRGIKTALNLHPRDGILADEAQYDDMCEALGKDKNGKPVEFDVSDRAFMENYFKKVINPYEDNGIDFWWLDWQQPGGSSKAGYDALWMLNHCHYLDGAKKGKRPLNFSRYAEIGSHRYPIGFSGDTVISWESLQFQPNFTATASNVGFSWWSHDIGGFKPGIRDAELYTRWAQLGVFSPIMRLHSTPHQFVSKEPWKWGSEASRIVGEFMRLRHKLIPYIFTMMYRNHEEGIPLVRPMYHTHISAGEATELRNEYWFGTSLIAAPITQQRDAQSGLAEVGVWLPSGTYVDFFNGRVYSGNKKFKAYRKLDTFPLFAKAGAIIPLANDGVKNGTDNPENIELMVFGGADGAFTMVEDNGKMKDENIVCRTEYTLAYGEETVLTIKSPCATEDIPCKRNYTVKFVAFEEPESVTVNGAFAEFKYDRKTNTVTVATFTADENSCVSVSVKTSGNLPENEVKENAYELLTSINGLPGMQLEALNRIVNKSDNAASRVMEVCSITGDEYLKGALIEILSAF